MTERLRSAARIGLLFAVVFLTACGPSTETPATEAVVSLVGEWEWRRGDLRTTALPGGETWRKVTLPTRLSDLEELQDYRGSLTLRHALPPSVAARFAAGEPTALFSGQISDVFRIYFNDRSIGERGSREPYAPGAYRLVIADLPGQAYRANQSNYIYYELYTNGDYPLEVYGPEIEIGSAGALYNQYHLREILSLLLLAIYFVIGVYHLLLSVRRPKDLYNLYFGLFAVLVSVYWFFTTATRDVIFGDAVQLRINLEHFILFLLGPPFLLFLSHFFYNRHSQVSLGIAAFHGSLALALWPGDYDWLASLLTVWQLSALALMAYLIFYIIQAWRRGRPDAGVLILGVVILMLAAIQDILAILGILPTPQIAKYFFIFFLPGIAAVLANRFTRVHNEADHLNEKLEEEVADRTRDLNHTLRELNFAKAETDDILQTVQEGLFLVSRQEDAYPIGGQHSSELANILETEDLAGRDFLSVADPLLDEGARVNLRKYLEMMFDPAKKARVVNKLNPLARIEASFGEAGHKHLEFHLSRVVRDGDIVQLMVGVKDVTSAVELSRQLEASEAKTRAARERAGVLFSVDPMMLSDFIEDTETEFSHASALLNQPPEDDREFLAEMFRSLHSIKGNANLLNLTFIGEIAHEFEADIERLQQAGAGRETIVAELNPRREELNEILGEVKDWVKRLAEFQSNYGQARTRSGEYFMNTLTETVQRLAQEYGKDIALAHDDFQYDRIPRARQKLARDALVQTVRNSIVHGIEAPDERRAADKSPRGTIRLVTREENGQTTLVVRDDGRGIQVARLRQKALDSDRWSAGEVEGWSDGQVARLIFTSGISTAESADLHAGRGVGMDLLKQRWEASGGKIQVAFQAGKFTEFRLVLPSETDENRNS